MEVNRFAQEHEMDMEFEPSNMSFKEGKVGEPSTNTYILFGISSFNLSVNHI